MKIALVTGASKGLGKQFVHLLQEESQLEEIWVVARSKALLQKLQEDSHATLRIFPLDLTQLSSLTVLQKALKAENPSIHFFINSAGFGRIGSYHDISLTDSAAMIDLNCRSAVLLTQIVVNYMTAGSHIAEICSTAAFQPLPYFNIYAASKSFLYHYCLALQSELKERNIIVTAVCPYWLKDTNFIGTASKNINTRYIKNFLFASTAEKIAPKAWSDILHGYTLSTPGHICTLHHIFSKFLPYSFLIYCWNKLRRWQFKS